MITKHARVDLDGEQGTDTKAGLWLAPGAPVSIELGPERPRVRLMVRGIAAASGSVGSNAVGRVYRPDPLSAGPEARQQLIFEASMPLFSAPDRGAFALLDMRVGGLVIGVDDDAELLPARYFETFTTEEVGRSGEWVEVVVRDDDGSYELRGFTPASAVQPRKPHFIAMPWDSRAPLPAGFVLRDGHGAAIGRTTAEGRYHPGEEEGRVILETSLEHIEVWVDRDDGAAP